MNSGRAARNMPAPPNLTSSTLASHPTKMLNHTAAIGQLDHNRYPIGCSGHQASAGAGSEHAGHARADRHVAERAVALRTRRTALDKLRVNDSIDSGVPITAAALIGDCGLAPSVLAWLYST